MSKYRAVVPLMMALLISLFLFWHTRDPAARDTPQPPLFDQGFQLGINTASHQYGLEPSTAEPETTTLVYLAAYADADTGHTAYPTAVDRVIQDSGNGLDVMRVNLTKEWPDSAFYRSSYLQGRAIDDEPLTIRALVLPIGVYFDLSEIPTGSTIQSAKIGFRMDADINLTTAGRRMFAVVDTSAADIDSLLAAAPCSLAVAVHNDSTSRDATWNNSSKSLATMWADSMATRDDYHDFGIVSSDQVAGVSFTAGDAVAIDVTKAVQICCEYGIQGGIFWLWVEGFGGTFNVRGGPAATNSEHNPFLAVTYSTDPYRGPWAGHEAAFAFQSPDGHESGKLWAEVFDEFGLKMSIGVTGQHVPEDTSDNYLTAEELQELAAAGHEVFGHGYYGEGLQHFTATEAGNDSMRTDVDRAWIATRAAVSESGIKAFVYPTDEVSIEGIGELQREGYLGASMSTAGLGPSAGKTASGDDITSAFLDWDGTTNPFLAGAVPIWQIAGGSGNSKGDTTMTEAEILENLEDNVFSHFLDNGGQLVVTGSHSTKQDTIAYLYSPAIDTDELRWTLDHIASLRIVNIAPLGQHYAEYDHYHPYPEASLSDPILADVSGTIWAMALGSISEADSVKARMRLVGAAQETTTAWSKFDPAGNYSETFNSGLTTVPGDTINCYVQMMTKLDRITPFIDCGQYAVDAESNISKVE